MWAVIHVGGAQNKKFQEGDIQCIQFRFHLMTKIQTKKMINDNVQLKTKPVIYQLIFSAAIMVLCLFIFVYKNGTSSIDIKCLRCNTLPTHWAHHGQTTLKQRFIDVTDVDTMLFRRRLTMTCLLGRSQ